MLGVAAGLAFLGGGKAMAQDADAGSTTDLFTTVQDFTGWSNGGGSPVTSFGPVTAATYDADGSATNGLASGGGVGTPGSMQINTGSNAVGYTYTVFSANLLYNAAAMAAIDPGGSPGGTVPFSGTMYITYTAPTWVGPDVYYQVGLDIAYPGDGYYGTFFGGSAVSDGTIDGLATYTQAVPYSLVAGGGGGFSISPFFNAGTYGSGVGGTSNVMTSPWYVDDIEVPTSQVPEPATLGALGSGLTLLMLRRRRQA